MKPIVILGLIALAVIIIAEIAYIIRLNIKEKRRDSPSVRAWKNFISQAHLFTYKSCDEVHEGLYDMIWLYGGYEINVWVDTDGEVFKSAPVVSIHLKDFDYLHDTGEAVVLGSWGKESEKLAKILLERFNTEIRPNLA